MKRSDNKSRRGSQLLLQESVQHRPDLLLACLRESGAIHHGETVAWVSPLVEDGYKEYKDAEFVAKLGLTNQLNVPLVSFWPRSGPRWDALGITSDGWPVLVEAKAHISEAASPGSTAVADKSVKLISSSLDKARRHIAPRSSASWTNTFYQYTNRLAHQYFFRELNGINSVLVFLYFLNAEEMNGPRTMEEWHGAIKLMHKLLQIPDDLEKFGVYHAFLDANLVPGAA